MSYINTFGGGTVQSSNTSYARYDISVASIELAWPSAFQDTLNVVYDFMNILSTNGGRTITLPAADLASVGVSFKFINQGAQTINILKSGGATLLPITSGQAWELYLKDNTTAGGDWGFIPTGNGTSGVVSFTSVAPVAGLTINQPLTTGAITQTFALANDLLALENLIGTGYAVRTNTDAWALRSIVSANANIAIANPAGTVGNTTITLNTALTGMTAIAVGNLNLTGNTISTGVGNDIILAPFLGGQVKVTSILALFKDGVFPPRLRFYDNVNTNFIELNSPDIAYGANSFYVLPEVLPTLNGQVLSASFPVASSSDLSWTTLPVVQTVITSSTAAVNSAVVRALNDTIPQIGDGTLLLTRTITPQYTGKLIIEFTASLANTSVPANIIVALFQDATANALTAGAFWCANPGSGTPLSLRYVLPAAVAGVATTFSIRYAISTAGSAYILTGNSGTGTLGAVPQMNLTVTELAP
jgi:hypothetical protein